MDIINELKNVVKSEKATIAGVNSCIDKSYLKAVQMIYRCKGKIILTGIGKSGIIAQKISATMVSTGTPAVYLHPTEGMHGDIGIVQKQDIVIAIGKSGESSELNDVLLTIKKIGSKIVSITSNKHSTLAKYSDVVLYIKVEKEACPYNLAPTNSTTAALVVGDAIAITVMKLRGFKKANFALFHPGGILGRRLLLTVKDVMRSGEHNPVIHVYDSVKNMLEEITVKMAGAVSVVDSKGRLAGLITDYDIRKIIEQGDDIFKYKIAAIMNKNAMSISPEVKAINALHIMEKCDRPISLMPVVGKGKKVVGMVHIHDILAKGI